MIKSFVESKSWSCEIELSPFPISNPDIWDHYAPPSATHYVNVLEPWHKVKIERFRDAGRQVEYKHDKREGSSTDIRKMIAHGDPWEHEVPDAVVNHIKNINGKKRIRRIWETD